MASIEHPNKVTRYVYAPLIRIMQKSERIDSVHILNYAVNCYTHEYPNSILSEIFFLLHMFVFQFLTILLGRWYTDL